MVGNVGGRGPNSTLEINSVVNFLKNHATDLGKGEIDFDNIMPGYKADIRNFETEDAHFMVVRDEYGQYIYAWPAGTNVSHHQQRKVGMNYTMDQYIAVVSQLHEFAEDGEEPEYLARDAEQDHPDLVAFMRHTWDITDPVEELSKDIKAGHITHKQER